MKINESGIKIKRAGWQDINDLREIGRLSYIPHYTHLWKAGGVEWYLNHCFGNDNLQPELADPNVEYYFVTAEDQNIGILKLVLRKPLPDSDIENALYLEKIYFIKEWTGKGVGWEAMQFAFKRSRELSRECVWLMAMDTSDKPIAAYQRAGFTEHSRPRLDFELMKEEFRGMVILKNCFNNGN